MEILITVKYANQIVVHGVKTIEAY